MVICDEQWSMAPCVRACVRQLFQDLDVAASIDPPITCLPLPGRQHRTSSAPAATGVPICPSAQHTKASWHWQNYRAHVMHSNHPMDWGDPWHAAGPAPAGRPAVPGIMAWSLDKYQLSPNML